MRRAFNKARFTGDQQDWAAHAEAQRRYKYEVLAAQKKGWQDYCERIESYPEAARLNRIMSGKPGGWLEAIRLPNGEYAESEEECLKLLLQSHYPGFREETEGEDVEAVSPRRAKRTSWMLARCIFSLERVRWAVSKMEPYKAPGPDGIYPSTCSELPWRSGMSRSHGGSQGRCSSQR